jgi:hypothetical protein
MFGGNSEEAYKAMGIMSAENSYISNQELQALKGLYGGNAKELADAKAMMASFNHLNQLGGMDSVKDKMTSLGIKDVRTFSEFASNDYTLNANMATSLNTKFGTSGFREGQKLSFNVTNDGVISNVVATGVFDGSVAGHGISGTETITFGNNGGILQQSYSGNINGISGSLLTDGLGQQIFFSGESGSRVTDYDVMAKNIARGVNVDEATARAILAKDTSAIENLVTELK